MTFENSLGRYYLTDCVESISWYWTLINCPCVVMVVINDKIYITTVTSFNEFMRRISRLTHSYAQYFSSKIQFCSKWQCRNRWKLLLIIKKGEDTPALIIITDIRNRYLCEPSRIQVAYFTRKRRDIGFIKLDSMSIGLRLKTFLL